jgi:mannose-6-phosphate isomerase-like protein (cupin superfamily)
VNRVHHLFSRRHPITTSAFFGQTPTGNTAVSLATMELGSSELRVGYVTTRPGGLFPAQYHLGGPEIAFILQGQGCIEVLSECYPPASVHNEQPLYRVDLEPEDVVVIPEGLLYQVRNTTSARLLEALVCFPSQVSSYWPDGTLADHEEEKQ